MSGNGIQEQFQHVRSRLTGAHLLFPMMTSRAEVIQGIDGDEYLDSTHGVKHM